MSDESDLDTAEIQLPSVDTRMPEPFSSRVRIDVSASSHPGKVRPRNEDHYFVARFGRHLGTLLTNLPEGEVPKQFDETGYAMIVADGMGGMAGGDVASRLAIRTLVQIVLEVPDWILRLDEEHIGEVMRRAAERYRKIDSTLVQYAQAHPELRGMGTTMTAAYSLGRDLFIAHVGDSRAYLFRSGKLERLTRDQTQAQMLADAGIIKREDVATHHWRHILTNALGAGKTDMDAEVERLELAEGDRLLLCTDGLTDMVEDREIQALLQQNEKSTDACRALVGRALEHGGRDNVTTVVARYSFP